jgi:hypothetical protein
MAGKVKPIPDGYHTVTPYFTVKDGPAPWSSTSRHLALSS